MSKLTVSTTINAPIEKVWDALWNPIHIVGWCFASDDWHCPKAIWEEPKVWGIFTNTFAAKDGSFSFDFTAKYDVVEPMKYIKYTMGEMKEYFLDAWRQVEITLEELPCPPVKGGGEAGGFCTKVTEVFDAEELHPAEMQIQWWSAILANLKKHVEWIK